VTERLNQAVTTRSQANNHPPLTLSIGLTEAVPDDDPVTLIARADKALYQAKSDGRNCRRVVTVDVDPSAADGAIETGSLGSIMLPQVSSSVRSAPTS